MKNDGGSVGVCKAGVISKVSSFFPKSELQPIIWQYVLAALVFAVSLGGYFYIHYNPVQKYSQLIVGSMAWSAENKSHDFILLISMVFLFAIGYAVVFSLASGIYSNIGSRTELKMRDCMTYFCLPAILWVAGLLMTRNINLDFLVVSAFFIAIATGITFACYRRGLLSGEAENFQIINVFLLIIIFSVIGASASGIVLSRITFLWNYNILRFTTLCATSFSLGSLVFIFIMIYTHQNVESLKIKLRNGLLFSQALLPALYLLIIPSPWVTGKKYYGYEVSPALIILLAILLLTAYLDLWRRRDGKNKNLFSAISPYVMVGIIFLFKSPDVPLNILHLDGYPFDDYHFGEFLLPWWSLKEFGYIPMWDYTPARGLMNYLPGMVNDLFFGGAASTFAAARNLTGFLYLFLGFRVI